MATGLDPNLAVNSGELLISQVVTQEAMDRLLVAKGIFRKDEFLETVGKVNLDMAGIVSGWGERQNR